MSEWISVEERLPEYNVGVLVFYGGKHRRISIERHTHTDHRGEHWSGEYEHLLTHWMPLPDPPEEK